MERGTQKQRILEYMRTHGFITPIEALRDIGCMRLGARIWDLRHDGYTIRSRRIDYRNEHGEAKHFTAYILEEERTA